MPSGGNVGDRVASKVLVTGGTGLLGSRVVTALRERGRDVVAPNRLELDLSSKSSVEDYLSQNRLGTVIHCAARVGGILANITRPVDFLIDNLVMDTNLIAGCRREGIEEFLYIGSSCMYPAETHQPMAESQLLTGHLEPTNSGYAMAKLAGSEAMRLISKESGWPYRTIIPSNLYGPGESLNSRQSHLIAAIMAKMWRAHLEHQEEIVIWGSGSVRREFTYVDDLARWISSNAHKISEFPTEMNIGYGEDFSVLEFYEFAAKVSGFDGRFEFDTTMPEGMKRKLMDSTIAERDFAWAPTTSPSVGMSNIWDFLRSTGKA